MKDADLRAEINKRLTLNWLIQGAAQHAGMTLHHLVRNELTSIHPSLIDLYDQYALINLLQYWRFEAAILLGWPPRFWKRAATNPNHPFFGHPVLSRHGGMLAAAAKERAVERCKNKRFPRLPILFLGKVMYVTARLKTIEAHHAEELLELAKDAVRSVWGIPTERLIAEMTQHVAFGNLNRPRTLRGRILRAMVVGYGGVLRRGNSMVVVARAANWQLLAKELVKGTAELICLHGLNNLDDDKYREVMRQADRIEFEPWMLQTGGELWRRLLTVLPDGRPLAEMMMHLARMPAKALESIVLAVIERPDWARELLANLNGPETEPPSDGW